MKRPSIISLIDRRRSRRGAIFITALGIIVILSGLVLVFAQGMRTEALASVNRLAALQADSIEQGAERWVLAQVEANAGDTTTIIQTPAEALPVGKGYFWILRPSQLNDQTYDFGIADECGKLNINTATANQLLMFPNMIEEAAEAIVDWRDPSGSAGIDALYSSLPDSYQAKHEPFETVEELSLLNWSTAGAPDRGVTQEMLYGLDRNQDGVVDDAERAAGNLGTLFNGGESSERGLIHYLTAYSADSTARLNVNNINSGTTSQSAQAILTNAGIPAQRASQIVSTWQRERRGRGRRFATLADFHTRVMPTLSEFKLVADKLTASNALSRAPVVGLVNLRTASREVLICLGLSDANADKLISSRDAASDTTSAAWVFDALDANAATALIDSATVRSSQYSADIVAVSGDGRAFKRVRIVVDVAATPAKIVYRKELSSLGWPLPAEIRKSLRAGTGVVTGLGRSSGSGRINW